MKAAILTDTTKCIGCNQCVIACKKVNHLPPICRAGGICDDGLSARNWTSIVEGRSHAYVRKQCRHCLEPACVSACPVGALHENRDRRGGLRQLQVHGLPLLHDGVSLRHPALRLGPGGPLRAQVHSVLRPHSRRAGSRPAPKPVRPRPPSSATATNLLAEAHRRIAENPDLYREQGLGRARARRNIGAVHLQRRSLVSGAGDTRRERAASGDNRARHACRAVRLHRRAGGNGRAELDHRAAHEDPGGRVE